MVNKVVYSTSELYSVFNVFIPFPP